MTKPNPVVSATGHAWIVLTIVASFAWGTHFAHTQGRASVAALAITAGLWVTAGVVFAVSVALARP